MGLYYETNCKVHPSESMPQSTYFLRYDSYPQINSPANITIVEIINGHNKSVQSNEPSRPLVPQYIPGFIMAYIKLKEEKTRPTKDTSIPNKNFFKIILPHIHDQHH